MADQGTTPVVSNVRVGGSVQLALSGKVFHTTQNAVSNQRVVAVSGTATVLILWDEKIGRTVKPMFAVSLNGSTVNTVQPAQTTIPLAYASFDPLKGTPAVPANLTAGAANELHLVQFIVPPLESMQNAVASLGGSLERYVAGSAFVVRMPAGVREQVAALPFVRWVGAYHPAYRVDASTLATLVNSTPDGAAARYSIETLQRGPAQQNALKALIEGMGGLVNVITPDQFRMEATLTPAQLAAVVVRNEVNFIDPWQGPGGTDMDILRQYGGAVPVLSGVNMLGQGVRGEIFDTEVSATHPQWNGQVPLYNGPNGNSGTHGSSCYGINFATGTGNAQATGLMPMREQGIFCWYPNSTQFGGATTRLALNTAATNPAGAYRSVFQTSSVGSPQIMTYSTISAETDDYLFKVDYLSCQSQSNTGNMNSRPQAWAKNIVAVGAFNHGPTPGTLTKTDDTSSGASFGYASDGRMKPEMCHAYENIFTTTSGTGYTNFGGTSGATPITAGHFGLLHQMWHQGAWSGFGGGASVFDSRPKSTTARALMIAAAFRYDWAAPSLVNGHINSALTRNRQGWGVADLGRLYQMKDKTFIVNESDVLTPLQSKSYCVEVAPGEQRLNITMVYIDPQGNPAVQAQHRVNNLDLKVTAPNGTVYLGNWGLTQPTGPGGAHSNWSVAGGNPDTKNTVENVFLFQPAAGTWTVEVIATELVQDAHLETTALDADFGLAVVGAVACAANCYPDCNGDQILNLADFGCFQTAFATGNMYADCNGDTILNLADFGCFQTQFAIGCP